MTPSPFVTTLDFSLLSPMLSRLLTNARSLLAFTPALSTMSPNNSTPPAPTVPTAVAARSSISSSAVSQPTQIATFASGCFWGTEHIFRQYYIGKGIIDAKVGFTGGNVDDPGYRRVCVGNTGHAEAVRVEFDPGQVPYAELVEFFYRTHDPTTLNKQGNDQGTQYRSAIFYHSPEQKEIATRVTAEVEEKYVKPKGKRIVTEIVEAGKWWDAEDYHQEYLYKNPDGYQCSTHRLWW